MLLGKLPISLLLFASDLQGASFHSVAGILVHSSITEPSSLLILIEGSFRALEPYDDGK